MAETVGDREMAKKPTDATSKAQGNLVRVSKSFADALNSAARLEKMSAADFADAHLLPAVNRRYKEVILKEAKRLGGAEK